MAQKRIRPITRVFQLLVDAVDGDRAVLTSLHEDTTPYKQWRNQKGWSTDADLKEWYGVTTDDNGRVIKLNLSCNDLQGESFPVHEKNGDPIPRHYGWLFNAARKDCTSLDLRQRIVYYGLCFIHLWDNQGSHSTIHGG